MTCPTCHDDGFIVRERDHIGCPDCGPVRHDEFVCTSCGRLILSLVPRKPAPTVCGLCQVIDEFVTDPAERAEYRKLLLKVHEGKEKP